MKARILLTLQFIFLQYGLNNGQNRLSSCNLIWKPQIAGDEFPIYPVKLTDNLFVASATIYSALYGGTADNTTKTASFNPGRSSGNGFSPYSFYILTNPNDCSISWVDASGGITEPEYAVPLGGNRFVAMRKSHGKIMAGSFRYQPPDINFFYGVNPTDNWAVELLSCETLKSTENLRMVINDLQFENELNDEQADFMGFDTVENNSPVTIEHKITHERSVVTRYEITEKNSFAQATHTVSKFGLNLGFVSLDIGWEHLHQSETGRLSNIVKENEETVISSRTLIVPGFTNIEACSILFNAEQEPLNYKGIASFSIHGRDSTYVRNMILGEGYESSDILRTNATHVFVEVQGTFGIQTALRTKLFVHEQGQNDCQSMKKLINEYQRLKKFHPEKRMHIEELKKQINILTENVY